MKLSKQKFANYSKNDLQAFFRHKKKKEKNREHLSLFEAPPQGYQAAYSPAVDDLSFQGQQKSINVNHREIETFRGWIGRATLSVHHDRSGLGN